MTQLAAGQERALAIALFNETRRLLDQPERLPVDDEQMVHAAHASAYHWLVVGTAVNQVRAHWLCSRVYAVLARAEPAHWHAERALAGCQADGIGDWDLAFCFEALARAAAVAGDAARTRDWLEAARSAARDIAEDPDRQVVLADLATISVG